MSSRTWTHSVFVAIRGRIVRMATIVANAKFSSFIELQAEIWKLQEETNTIFVREDSIKTKAPSLKDRLQYDRVVFACKQGRERRPQGRGLRKVKRSVKLGCSAKIRAVMKEDAGTWSLVITTANLVHDTHNPSLQTVAVLPETRKIQETSDIDIVVGCPSIPVKDIIQVAQVLPKDIHNPGQKYKHGGSDAAKVEATLKSITENGGKVDFCTGSQGRLLYVSYVTGEMMTLAERYSQVLVMDMICTTNVCLLPLLTVMCIDHNGKGHPIFHSFLDTQDLGVFVTALQFLKTTFDSVSTSCFFVDQDISEIGAISTVFPENALIVCTFHIAAAVKKAISNKGLSSHQAETIKGLFMDMKDALTVEEYSSFKTKLIEVCSQPIIDYFEANWFCKPDLWAAHRQVEVGKLDVTTTNQFEWYHQKLKQTIQSSLSVNDCLTRLLGLDLESYSSFSFQNLKNSCTKPISYSGDATLDLIVRDLTPFAANLVGEQYRLFQKVPYSVRVDPAHPDTSFIGQHSNHYTVSSTVCSCSFFVNFRLPCAHVFFLRQSLALDLYQCLPVSHRFRPRLWGTGADLTGQMSSAVCASRRVNRNPEEKFKFAEVLSRKICSFMSLLGDCDFDDKYSQLSNLFSSWSGASTESYTPHTLDILDVPAPTPIPRDEDSVVLQLTRRKRKRIRDLKSFAGLSASDQS